MGSWWPFSLAELTIKWLITQCIDPRLHNLQLSEQFSVFRCKNLMGRNEVVFAAFIYMYALLLLA